MVAVRTEKGSPEIPWYDQCNNIPKVMFLPCGRGRKAVVSYHATCKRDEVWQLFLTVRQIKINRVSQSTGK